MIERESSDGILTLRLAHGKASALDLELCDAITHAFRACHDAPAVILTGSGRIFSAGVDLFRMTQEGASYVERFLPALSSMLTELFTFPRPLVAAVNGHAIAGGCLMAAASDYRLMSGGTIGVPELLVGVPFPAIAAEILRFASGRDAAWLAYTGATIAPAEGQQRGLVDEVIEPDQLMARASAIARQLAAIPADSFRLTKQMLRSEALERASKNEAVDHERARIWSDPAIHEHIRQYLARTVGKR